MNTMKKVTLFFDLENFWETPFRAPFDVRDCLKQIIKTLKKYGVQAVFNTAGIVAEKHPELIKQLFNQGHEMAVHGYIHENFVQLSEEELNAVLEKTEKSLESITGKRPIGLRAPWLFYDKKLYILLENRGYLWVSNRHTIHGERFSSPYPRAVFKIWGSTLPARIMSKIAWRTFPKKPYKDGSLIEIPLLSSMDGELLDLISPFQKSPDKWLDFTYQTWVRQYEQSGSYFNLNCHDWLIGSNNRIELLDRILSFLKGESTEFVLARDICDMV